MRREGQARLVDVPDQGLPERNGLRIQKSHRTVHGAIDLVTLLLQGGVTRMNRNGDNSPGREHPPPPGLPPLMETIVPPPRVTFRLVIVYGALDSHPFFPSHVASGRCFLSAAAAGAPAGVVSAFGEPSSWCAGTVLDVAWCAVCASAAPNNWRIEDVLVAAGVV